MPHGIKRSIVGPMNGIEDKQLDPATGGPDVLGPTGKPEAPEPVSVPCDVRLDVAAARYVR